MRTHLTARGPARALPLFLVLLLLLAGVATLAPSAGAASLAVTSALDAGDVQPGDGVCAAAGGQCTLRAAVHEANALPGADTIALPALVAVLAGEAGEDPLSGDLDITGPVTIAGAGAGASIIDGEGLDRLVELHETAGNVTLRGLTLRNGSSAEDGGGVLGRGEGLLRLVDVHVVNNTSSLEGGGVHMATGGLEVSGTSRFVGNVARAGGAIYGSGQATAVGLPMRITLNGTVLSANRSEAGAGAVFLEGEGSSLVVDRASVIDNVTDGDGAGLVVTGRATLSLSRSTLTGNRAGGDGAAVYTASERGVSISDSAFIDNHAEGSGGALAIGGSGGATLTGGSLERNTAGAYGGAVLIESLGAVTLADARLVANVAGAGGGAVQNEGQRVTLDGLVIRDNRATDEGGGVLSEGSGAFTIRDTLFVGNRAQNGGGYANEADGTSQVVDTTFWDNRAIRGAGEEWGLGGAIFSQGDAGASYQNITLANNLAQARGGGLYVDADAPVAISHATFAGNAAPAGSAIAGEIASVSVPPQPSAGVSITNSILSSTTTTGDVCSFAITSGGGNVATDDSCSLIGSRDRVVSDVGLDAISDNGGPTPTVALRPGSRAIDNAPGACAELDQRGVERPQNRFCDSGAFEFEGPFPPNDIEPPETIVLSGPVQDTVATSLFRFGGFDDRTAMADLVYECRLTEFDPTEVPEIPDPTEVPGPEFAFLGCANPWQTKLIEEGSFLLEVRAIDLAGNTDPTPFEYRFDVEPDITPPDTVILDGPPATTAATVAALTFDARDGAQSVPFAEFECRLDTNDPALWLECSNPAVFSDLTPGEHRFQVRAGDASDNVDPTPATFVWTVREPEVCEQGNLTLGAQADAHVDQSLPLDNFGQELGMVVRSQAGGANARTFVRFAIPAGPPGCELESATLRLNSAGDPGRTLEATPLGQPWDEGQITWNMQPATAGDPVGTTSGDGYRDWLVTDHVRAVLAGAPSHGWRIRDAAEGQQDGGEQVFISSETEAIPAFPPRLVLRYSASGVVRPPAPAPASAPRVVACGEVLTGSVRLANDLVDCPGEGLVIGADDIDVDLNGHTVDSGAIIEPGEEVGLLAGIRNTGHSNVVIRGGTVTGFGYGVRLMAGARWSVVTDMRLVGNVNAGVELLDADDGRNGNAVVDNHFEENGAGVAVVSGSENSSVENNTFRGNAGQGVLVTDSSGIRVAGNDISGATSNPLLDSDGGIRVEASPGTELVDNLLADAGDAAIQILGGSHDALVMGNTAVRSSDSGLSVSDSDRPRVIFNVFHLHGGAAIGLDGVSEAVVTDNDVRFNPGGIQAYALTGSEILRNDADQSRSSGITLAEGSFGNRIAQNRASFTNGTGISLESGAPPLSGAEGNVIEDNDASGNGGDGIAVADAGFGIGAPGHTVTGNRAHNNGAFGIDASDETLDGGGNEASGNQEPEQCRGVICEPGDAPAPSPADIGSPDTEILATPPPGVSTQSRITFTFTGSDAIAPATALRFECRLDAPPDPAPEPPEPGEAPQAPPSELWEECASPFTLTDLTAEEHTFEVRAIDPADNPDITPARHTFTVVAAPDGADAIAPTVRIVAGPEDQTAATTAAIGFRASDNQTPGTMLAAECRLDGAAFAPCISPVTYEGLALGEHTVQVRVRDLAGNVSDVAERAWTVIARPLDETAPETIIDSGPDRTTVVTSATFAFRGTGDDDDEDLSFECRLDGGPFVPCDSPQQYDGLGVGEHTLRVRAVDDDDNADPTPATYAWTIGPAPVATNVACGDLITESILVANDLLACPENGLVVGAEAITIDLGGHTIAGTGLGAGVLVDGFDSVTVTNGVLSGFDAGVHFGAGAGEGIVDHVDAVQNQEAGVLMLAAHEDGVGNTVRHSTLAGNGYGVHVAEGTRGALIQDNVAVGNAGEGILLENASGGTVERNEVAGSADAGIRGIAAPDSRFVDNVVAGSSDGTLIVEQGSHRAHIEGNRLSDSEGGVEVADSDRVTVIHNIAQDMSDPGVVLENVNHSYVAFNDVTGNEAGIALSGSSDNLVERNEAGGTTGTGIEIGEFSEANRIVANQVSANSGSGVSVGGGAPPGRGNLIERNVANGNTADGIYIGGTGHVITGNRADDNDGWGIYSAQGTISGANIDGGGNRAVGNAVPEQCYLVSCDGGAPLPSDTTPPETAIESGPAAETTARRANIAFSGTDNATAVRFECRLDSQQPDGFVPCTSPAQFTNLGLGQHTFEVRAIDYLGNADPTPAVHEWAIVPTVPGIPPETTLTAGPDPVTVRTTARFTFESDEESAVFECSLDGASFVACLSPVEYTGLAVGPHTFAVRATDADGDTDQTPASVSWTVGAAPVPTTVTCGRVVTQSIRVLNDLTGCGGNALVVGAHDITIDLGGRTLAGTGLGAGVVTNGFDRVTITGGAITGFDFGVNLTQGTDGAIVENLNITQSQDAAVLLTGAGTLAQGNTLRGLTIGANVAGVLATGSVGTRVLGGTFADIAGDAVQIAGGSDNEVRGLTITEPSGSGISLLGTTRTTVADTTITGASGDGVTVGEELAPSNDNLITGNRSSTSGGAGVAITASRGNLVVGNTLTSAGGGGITLFQADDNTVRGNDAGGNSGGGIDLNQSNDNRIEQNAVNGGSGGIGLDGESNGNLIALNSTNANSGDGIYINGAAPAGRPNILDRNTANGNSQGIFINGAGHVLAGNRADLNDGWGIYAPGAVDGDANQATGNAEPAQCFGITCIIGIPPGAPDTSIVLRPTDPSNSRNAVFTFTGSDNTTAPAGLSFECRLDSTVDTAWVECDNPYEITDLSPGMHRFEVRAIDQDGLTDPTPAVATWFYEPLPAGVAPETSILLRPAPVTPLLEGYFTFTSNEPDVTFECQLDGGAWQPCVQAFIYEFEEFEVGSHTFRVRATDAEGLTDPTPATHTWIVSGVVTTITDGPAFVAPGEPGEPAEGGETIERTARFEFTANVADAEFDCSIDLGPFVPCAPGVTYTDLAVGTHSFRIFATDPETGYSDLEPVEYEWVVLPATDVVPPDTDVIGGPDDPTGAATYRFTGTDNVTTPEGLTFECAIDGATEADFQECASPWTVPSDTVSEPLAAGPHTLYVRAIDAEGNIDPTPADFPHIYPGDAIAPVAAITSGPSGQTGTTTAVFGLSADDRFATFTCSLDRPGEEPPAVQECATGVTFTDLAPGTHTLGVVATDLVGNVGPEAVRSWTVVAPPETEITDGPSQTEISELRTARFEFTSDQAPAVSFRCSLDGGAFVLCSSPYEVQVTTSGEHTLRVRAQNAFGGVDPTPAEWTWNVQLPPPPAASITDAPEENGIATTATIAFTSDLAGAVGDVTFECSTDGVGFAPCASPVTLTDLAPGEYEFFVRAVHPERGTGAMVSAEWNVQPEPQTTITGAPEASTTDTEAVITFTTGPAPAAAAECSVDGEAFAPCASPLVLTGLAVGDHTVAVRAVDGFGNADPTPALHSWTVEAPPADTTPPDTAVGSGPSVTTSATGATFAFTATEQGSTFECALDGGEAAPCTSPATVSGLPDGTHTFTVAAVDAAGNVDPDPAVHTWTVDTVAPQTGIGTAPAALTSATAASFALTASEPGATFVCSLDGATATPCTSPRAYSGLAPGAHTFRAQAVDAAGNVDGTPAVHTWTVDTAAPETTIGSAPAATTTATTASFSFTASEPGSTFLCSLDGATATPCTSPRAYSGLAAGVHTFRVQAVDAAGNADATPATHSWTVGSACTASTVTLPSVADAWILSSSTSQNKGTDSVLKVASKSGDNARALVRFTLPAIPAGCQVTSARLRLYNGSPKSGRTIQALRATAAWTESQVRWSNQPATDPTAATATTTSSANWMEWTVTTQVRAMYPSANHGFVIRDAAENGGGQEQQFHSREKAPDRPPQLVVTFG